MCERLLTLDIPLDLGYGIPSRIYREKDGQDDFFSCFFIDDLYCFSHLVQFFRADVGTMGETKV